VIYVLQQSTTLRIRYKTKEALERLGKFGETHDDIIQRLINEYTQGSSIRDEAFADAFRDQLKTI